MTLPVGTRGHLVAWALILIPALLLLQYVFLPMLQSFMSKGDELETTREQIAHYQRLLNEMPGLKAAALQLERTRPLSPYLLSGSNRALAAADLQRRLKDVAKEEGVTILSTRAKNPSIDGPLQRISVTARLRAGTQELVNLLHRIESATPYLFVEDLSITVRQSRRRKSTQTRGLEVSLVLYGLRPPDTATDMGAVRG